MPLPYRQVSDLYGKLKDSGVVSTSLPEWSQEMNQLTGTDLYAEGENDNWVRRASTGLDKVLEATGLPYAFGEAGAGIGSLFGAEETGRQIGHGALRGAVDFAPLLIPGVGPVAGALGAGLLSGGHTYADTGSVASGILSGLTAAAMPKAFNLGEQSALKFLGGSRVVGRAGETAIDTYLPKSLAQGVGSIVTGNLTAGALGEASRAGEAGLDPNTDYSFDPTRSFLEMTVGQLPFAAIYGTAKGRVALGGETTRAHETALRGAIKDTLDRTAFKEAQDALKSKTPLEHIPLVDPPAAPDLTIQAATRAKLDKLVGRAAEIQDDPTPTTVEEYNAIAKEHSDAYAEHEGWLSKDPYTLPLEDAPSAVPYGTNFTKEEYLAKAENDVSAAKNEVDLAVAFGRLNRMLKGYGMAEWSPSAIEGWSRMLNIDKKSAAKAAVNHTKRVVDEVEVERAKWAAMAETDKENIQRATAKETGVVKLPVRDNTTFPLHQILDEVITAQVGAKGSEAFAKWQQSAPATEKTSLPLEQERYKIYWRLREDGDIGRETTLSKNDADVLNDAWGDEGIRAERPDAASTFPTRDHVGVWDGAVKQAIATRMSASSAPGQAPSPSIPAGGGFVWGLEGYDPIANKIGKHTLPKTGVVRESLFKNIGGRGKPLADAEVALGKLIVPEAFDGQGNVDVRKLYDGLAKKGPVVEIKKLGENTNVGQEKAQVRHELDTRFPGWEERENEGINASPEEHQLLERYHSLGEVGAGGGSRYSFLGPKSETEMPGYVEGLVRVPTKGLVGDKELLQNVSDLELEGGKGTLYRGPHFGSEDTNVLAFFRGYEETLADGRKAFHVIEVQSDWGQQARKNAQVRQEQGNDPGWLTANEKSGEQGHPLLSVYEPLALKAAIQHAKSVGADAIVLSDAKTAMMTEGHDKAAERQVAVDKGQHVPEHLQRGRTADGRYLVSKRDATDFDLKGEQAPLSQEGGMRLHYDQTLPSALAKLTGAKGEKVKVGQHKAAVKDMTNSDVTPEIERLSEAANRGEITQHEFIRQREALLPVTGSPVFRDATGAPKTAITGRAYSLDKIADIASVQGGLTLTDPSRAPGKPPLWRPTLPEQADVLQRMGLERGGHGLVDFVLGDTGDAPDRAFAQDLKDRFGEQLKRFAVVVRGSETPSAAYIHPPSRTGNIQIDEATLLARPEVRSREILHEIAHQLSVAELDNPTKVGPASALDALRERVIVKLPKDMANSLDNAVATDWLGRWGRGEETDFRTLHPDWEKAQVLYGLLNTHEFVSQGFTSKPFRDHLLSGKSEGKGWWNKFKSFVGELVGVKGTHLAEFLHHTDELMRTGEHVASFYNFGERYLEGMGHGRQYANIQTQRAHALVKEANQFQVTGTDLLQTLDANEVMRSPAFNRARNALERSVQNVDPEYESLAALAPEMGVEPHRVGIDEFVQNALAGENRGIFDVLPDTTARYVFEKLHNMREVLDTLKAMSDKKNEGFVNLADPKAIRGPVKDALKRIDALLDHERMLDQGVAMIQGLSGISPNGYFEKMQQAAGPLSQGSAAPPMAEALAGGEPGTRSAKRGFWDKFVRFLRPIAQNQDPAFKEGAVYGYQLGPNTRKMVMEASKAYIYDLHTNQVGTGNAAERQAKAVSDPQIRNAIDAWHHLNQKRGGEAVQRVPETDPEVAAILSKLPADKRSIVIDQVDYAGVAKRIMDKQIQEKAEKMAVTDAAGMLNQVNGAKLLINLTLAEETWKALNANWANPQEAAVAQGAIAQIQSRMTPKDFDSLLGLLQNSKAELDTMKSMMDANPYWMNAQRWGKYRVRFRDANGKIQLQGVDSEKEAKSLAKGRPYDFWEPARAGDDEFVSYGAMTEDMQNRLVTLREERAAKMSQLGYTADQINEMRAQSEVTQLLREAKAKGMEAPEAEPRGLTRGAENLPYTSNQISWFNAAAGRWSKKLFKSQMDAYIAQKELPDDVRADLRTHRDNMLQPDPSSVRALNDVARTWFMGFNVATPIVNAFQSVVNHVSELTALSGKPFQSYKYIFGAMKELTNYRKGAESDMGPRQEWGNAEIDKLMSRATADGEVDISKYDDHAAAQEAAAVRFKSYADKQKPKTFGQWATGPLAAVRNVGMLMFKMTEGFNNKVALIARFRQARDSGMAFDDAYRAAVDFNHTVNFGGGKAARPIGAFSGRSPVLRGAAMLGTMMQSYVLGTTFQLGRYLKAGLFRPGNLTPHEVYSARKAAVQMLGTQLAAAGLLGLPFVSAATSLLDKMFPELEVNKNLRSGVAGLFQADEEAGSPLTDIAMTGLPSMLGWDLQSRLSMGNTLPGVSEVNGFQPENLMGPPVNLISNFVKGGTQVLRGQATNAFTPPGVRKLVDLVSNGGILKDYRDRTIFRPTPGEAVGSALGFNPKRLSDFNAAERIARLADDNARNAIGSFHQQLAESVVAGNFGSAKAELRQRAAQDTEYNPVDGIRAVARAAEEMTFPRDLRRERGGPGSKLLSLWNLDQPVVSEQMRQQFRDGVEAGLGLQVPDGRSAQIAATMDALRVAHPGASRYALRRLAEQSVRHRIAPNLGE